MQKIYAFRVSLMNGTVTANTHVEACASRELAEQVKEAVRLANVNNDTLGGLRLHFSDIEELTLWESADEVPVLNPKPKTREQLEQERGQVLHDLTYARECMKELTRNDHTREWMSKMTARQEERLKEIEDELAALDGSPAPPADVDKSIVIDMTNKEQSVRIWHTEDERPADGSQVLIVKRNGIGTAGDYDTDSDYIEPAAGGRAAAWEEWDVDRWAYIGELTGKNEALRRAMEKEIEHMELRHSEAWNFEQAMMLDSRGLTNSTKAAYMITRWWQMLHMSVGDAKDWLARFGDAASGDNASARSMLENYISLTTEHLTRLDGIRKEYLERRRKEMGLSNDEQQG